MEIIGEGILLHIVIIKAFGLTTVNLDGVDGVFFEHHPLEENVKD